jgi:plastocyanin
MKNFLTIFTITAFSFSAFAAEHIINQKGKTFIPSSIKAKVGDTVRFKNSDPFAHNAFTDDPKNSFDTGLQGPNEDKVIHLKAKGKIKVGCNIHPNMSLMIEVE